MAAPLDLDQLQSFCAIADCGSFTEAARRVNKTQSAVSMQIKRLEERLGQTLLTRDGRSVSLTHHGEVLYERARKMLRANAEILDHFNDSDLAGSIRFGVEDTGCGMDEDELARVMNAFTQGNAQSHTGERGTGLGLAIVTGLVDAHGGTFGLESTPGVGTRATVTLPRARLIHAELAPARARA